MAPVDYESRAFLATLLREANVVEDIVEDVVEAFKLAEFSVLSIASGDISIEALAEKLYLTKDEARALRKTAAEKLKDETSLKSRPEHFRKPNFQKMISLHVVASRDDGNRTSHHRETSTLSIESFLGRDGEKKRVDTSSRGSEYQWTDSTTEREASEGTYRETSVEPADSLLLARRTSGRNAAHRTCKGENRHGNSGDSLTDRNLAHHDKNCRPYIPRLQLEDAGLSYGPPNSVCPSYETLDTLSISELQQMADLPVGHPYFKRRSRWPSIKRGGNQIADLTSQLNNKDRRSRLAAVLDLPSYRNVSHSIHKTTASFEASKRALRDRQERKAYLNELEKAKMLPIKRRTKPSSHLSARLTQSTEASRARDAELKKHQAATKPSIKFGSTNTIPSTFHVVVFPPYA